MSEFDNDPKQAAPEPEVSSTVEPEASAKTSIEEFLVNANTVTTRARELLQEGNVRQIVIKTEAGRPLFKIPFTVGFIGGTLGLMMSPLLITSVAALGVLAGRLTLVVEKNID
ncbi:MAG: DUF4342 domain-containing protein [Cyanobacteria bacterium P01_A01_bin.17]